LSPRLDNKVSILDRFAISLLHRRAVKHSNNGKMDPNNMMLTTVQKPDIPASSQKDNNSSG